MSIKLIASALAAVILLSVLTGTAHATGGEGGNTATVNGFQVNLVFQEPAKIGDNEFHVQITDSMGELVTNAKVEVTVMPADTVMDETSGASNSGGMGDMGGADAPTSTPSTGTQMGGMDTPTETSSNETNMGGQTTPGTIGPDEQINIMLEPGTESGEYTGAIHLDKAGAWMFQIHFTINGELNEVEFSVNAVSGTPKTGVLAGFIGFNASVIAVAAFLKRKSNLA